MRRAHHHARRRRASLLLYAICGLISQRAESIIGRLHDLNLSVSTFVQQVFVEGTRSTETSVFLLIMGALVWGAGYFARVQRLPPPQAAPAHRAGRR